MFNHNDYEQLMLNLTKNAQLWFKESLDKSGLSNEEQKLEMVNIYKHFFENSKSFLESQNNFYNTQIDSLNKIFKNHDYVNGDKRFTSKDWEDNPFFHYIKDSYFKFKNYLENVVNNVPMDDEQREKINFFVNVYLDAISPTNFVFTNPDVIKKSLETKGESVVNGMQKLMNDFQNGYISMTNEEVFGVKKNLAITKGNVIYKNNLVELIQYSPTTDNVYKIPLLIVPPCINKYYILDLQQENSLVKYLVDQGYVVYLISWKSADKSIKDYEWKNYIYEGVIDSIEAVRSISKVKKVNLLGYCIGGLILNTATLIMKSKKLDYVNTLTFLTSMFDHSYPGDVKFFIDNNIFKIVEKIKKNGGLVSGRLISQVFSTLRSKDLIWNYWVNNYLLGNDPSPFDILYWNNDVVDLPYFMHYFLIENFYIKNELVKGTMIIDNIQLDLGQIDQPVYMLAVEKDHIVPWKSVYNNIKYLNSKIRFVLGASGHTAGVINSASKNKKNYWINSKIYKNADKWFETAKEIPGSWWLDYNLWLKEQSGEKVNKFISSGNKNYPPLYEAPGEYVIQKAMTILESQII